MIYFTPTMYNKHEIMLKLHLSNEPFDDPLRGLLKDHSLKYLFKYIPLIKVLNTFSYLNNFH